MDEPDDGATVRLTVNGEGRTARVSSRDTLTDLLRQHLELRGTHLGCEQGSCGACTVLVDGAAVRSCLMLARQADGCDVRTVEGLSAGAGGLHPLQRAFWDAGALQCGFCTPGFLMTALAAVDEDRAGDRDRLRRRLSGNLCRCTGYESIINAVAAYAENRGHDGTDR